MFSELPTRYEFINHIFTFGLDMYWRKKTAEVAVSEKKGLFLDICTGTGEMAFEIAKMAGEDVKIIAVDFCLPMLRKAKEKGDSVSFIMGEAENLPFHDETFDLITISFATRNINTDRKNLLSCLKEFRRVLKGKGKFLNLETTQPESKIGRFFFHAYLKTFVEPLGKWISGSRGAYRYLSRTIHNFYEAEELKNLLEEAGFSNVIYTRFFPGIVALHMAEKQDY